jgi:hypothetical protein
LTPGLFFGVVIVKNYRVVVGTRDGGRSFLHPRRLSLDDHEVKSTRGCQPAMNIVRPFDCEAVVNLDSRAIVSHADHTVRWFWLDFHFAGSADE